MTSDARAWLEQHINLESLGVPAGPPRRTVHPTLERIRAIVELLGSPQLSYPVLHITGTNGKTSVSRLVTSLLVATGLSTGTYTSPNLVRVNERISWDGEEIDDDALDGALEAVRSVEQHLDELPSYFEILTAAAFEWFADVAVEAAVVEVGMGGTWDATNVADGRIALVTNIALDHVDVLGPTRLDIARDKSGIVKPGSILVLGETDPELVQVFRDRGPEQLILRDLDFGVRSDVVAAGGRVVTFFTPGREYRDVFVALHGAHQADNAALALAATEAFLGRALDPLVVAAAFENVRSPGRLEIVDRRPLVLLDGAHNVAGAEALAAALTEAFGDSDRTLVVGMLKPHDHVGVLDALRVADASRLVLCRAPSPRAVDPDELAAEARALGVPADRIEVVETVHDAIERARLLTPADGQIVVTGSLYVVGAARAELVADPVGRGGVR